MGRIETRHIAYPIRSLHWKDRFKFIQADVEKIDTEARKVVTTAGTLDFDYLVLALGSFTDVTGVDPNAENVFMLKTLNDGMLIRNHIIRKFEQANIETNPDRRKQLLTFVVAGAGYTGVQVVTGLRDLVYKILPKYYKMVDRDSIRIILIEAAPKIVADLDTRIGSYVMDYLKATDIEVRLQSRVTHAWENGVEINNNENIAAGTVIWASGVAVNPRIAELNVAKDSMGRVLVNEYLEVPEFPGVYAVGDCVHFKDPKSGHPIPPLAHTAVRQARVVAKNVLADIRGLNRKTYRYSKPPDLINLGTYKAVFRFRFVRLYGFLARFMLTLAYLLLITGIPNRIRIVTDWLLSLTFGRDTTLLRNNK